MNKTQKGFALTATLLIVFGAFIIAGTGWYVFDSSKKSDESLNNANKSSQSLPQLSPSNKTEAGEDAPTETPSQTSSPTPAPKASSPAVDLYDSPQDSFSACPGTTTAYVVNKSGANLYKDYANASSKSGSLGKAPYKSAMQKVGCQDGDAVMATYKGVEYVVLPADIRKAQPQ